MARREFEVSSASGCAEGVRRAHRLETKEQEAETWDALVNGYASCRRAVTATEVREQC